MRIKAIRLENIRSHVDTRITFEEGFNCLIGGLGAGKTSVLYAIDFALFGEPLGKGYAYLLRDGAAIGKVTLWFSHGGSDYVIMRGLRRMGTRIVQDTASLRFFKDGKPIAEKRASAVTEQVEKELGVNVELFRQVMWIRQEQLKAILDMGPRERQKLLDALLGLEDFESAWAALRTYESFYKREHELLSRDPDILMAERLEEEHGKLTEELARISLELEELRPELEEAAEAVREAEKALKELEEKRRAYEELVRKRASVEAAIGEAEKAIKRLEAEVEHRRKRLEELEKEMEELVAKEVECRRSLALIGLDAGASVEEAEKELRRIEERVEELSRRSAGLENEIAGTRQRLEIISTESRCPTCLRFMDEDFRRDLTAKLKRELVKMEHELEGLRGEASELREKRASLAGIIRDLRLLTSRKDDVQARTEDERASLGRTERELDSARMRLEMLRVELEALDEKLSGFDAEELEKARGELEERRRKLMELEARERDLRARRELVRERLEDCEKRLERADEKRRRAERAAKLVQLIRLLRSAYRSVQPHLRTEIVRLAGLYVQRVLDEISGPEGASVLVEIGQDYTPIVKVNGRERSTTHLSGGERTLLALAYRIGMGHLIMQARTGRSLEFLMLDEPTESLGREDQSVDKLADAISRLKTVEQVIAVSHSEAFAERANHVIRVEKTDNVSHVRVEDRAS